MTAVTVPGREAPPVDDTLRRVVLTYRILTLIWIWVLVIAVLVRDGPGSRPVLYATAGGAAVWAGVTTWASQRASRLGSIQFVILDGLVALLLGSAAFLGGTGDFISGGWPGSWLFVVAFASTIWGTIAAATVLLFEHVALHLAMGLSDIRIAGTFQFIALAVIIGWAFDALRERERLRLEVQAELDRERVALEREREATTRHEERAALARHLHDEVLQTLHAISTNADEPAQVRYFSRRQTRELRRTIEDFRSPYEHSFRASLLQHRDDVEDLYQGVTINEVIRSDAEITPSLEIALGAAREAMVNAAKHSGAHQVDLYSEIEDGIASIHVRDRGCGFFFDTSSSSGVGLSISTEITEAGGRFSLKSAPSQGTQVSIVIPV